MIVKKTMPLASLVGVFVFAMLCKLFIFDVTRVYGHSMEPILEPGKIIVSVRLAYGILLPFGNRYLVMWGKPARGDVIVLENPDEGTTIVKRCVGIEGDMILVEKGSLVVGDMPIAGSSQRLNWELNRKRIPRDHIFVVGDNAEKSIDSRSFGFVSIRKVFGKVLFLKEHRGG